MKAVSSEGVCILCFRNQELIHHSKKVYFSLPSSAEVINYCITCIAEAEEDRCDGLRNDLLTLRRVFSSVDGAHLSLFSRKESLLDETCLTYAETDALSFINLLRDNIASDAQVFYDLGCGVGTLTLTSC